MADGAFHPLRAWLEYSGLWAIAIAYPLFHGIASGPEALTVEGAGRLDVILLILVVALIPPVVLTGIEFVVAIVKPRAGVHLRAVLLGALAGLVVWQALRDLGEGSVIRTAVPLLVAGLFALARIRLELVRNFTEILAIALPVVIVQFCLSAPVRAEVFPHGGAGETPRIESGTPVVMIVLDEFSLPVIERSPNEIDGRLFPGFAGLADEATWYPNALAVADMSTSAVPTILTGDYPDSDDPQLPPSKSKHPDNLCTELASGGYTVDAMESLTNLCGQGYPLLTRITEMIQRGSTTPIVPGAFIHKAAAKVKNWTGRGYGEDVNRRAERADDFIAGLEAGPDRFDLMHSILPHSPWEYMPDGERYGAVTFPYVKWDDSPNKVNAEMQRMMAQLQYVDHQLTGWIEELKRKGIWQKALVVVTADHGINFAAGENGRILNAENAGSVLPVPLFIKYPGQSRGKIDPRPASSIDIAPTVDAVIGADPPDPRDGRSLLADPPPEPSPRVDAVGFSGPDEFPRRQVDRQRREVIAHARRLFGSGTVFAVGGHERLLGNRVADVPGLRPLAATLDLPFLWEDVDTDFPVLPVMVDATIPSGVAADQLPPSGDPSIAVAINGRVAATTRTWEEAPGTRRLRVIVPPATLRDGPNEVEMYAIDRDLRSPADDGN